MGTFGGTPLMYCFRERERILDMFEMLCGARITVSYMRPGGVTQDAPPEWFWEALAVFTRDMPGYIDDLEGLISDNEGGCWPATRDVGIPVRRACRGGGFGDRSHAEGQRRPSGTLRKADPYEIYDRVEFDVPIGATGDTFDRYIVRVQEMRESVRIIEQCVEQIPRRACAVRCAPLLHEAPPAGDAYAAVEAPKGELGLLSRERRRHLALSLQDQWSPSFINMNVLKEMLVGWKMGDLIIIFGSTRHRHGRGWTGRMPLEALYNRRHFYSSTRPVRHLCVRACRSEDADSSGRKRCAVRAEEWPSWVPRGVSEEW